jgi:hypothetical protein
MDEGNCFNGGFNQQKAKRTVLKYKFLNGLQIRICLPDKVMIATNIQCLNIQWFL